MLDFTRVHSIYPYEKLRDANVYGTENAIALASIGPALLFHVSTLSVHSPFNPHTRIKEDAPLRYFHGLDSGYAQTKWVAEKLGKRLCLISLILHYLTRAFFNYVLISERRW